jgi:Glycosyl hydrolase family 9
VQYTAIPATWYNETTNSYVNQTVDLSGGFYNDGEVGPVKLTYNIALTTSMLAWSMLEYQDFWAADEERKNLVSSVLRHGAAYVSETYVQNPLRNPQDPTRPAQPSYDLLYYVVRAHLVP